MNIWRAELWWWGAVAFLAFLGGTLVDRAAEFLALGLLAYVGRHLYYLRVLSKALDQGNKLKPPYPAGPWQFLFSQVRRLQVRSRKRKRRLTRFLTRFREAAVALPSAAVILGRSNDVQWFNPSAAQLLGLSRPRVAGKSITQVVGDPALTEYIDGNDFTNRVEMTSPANKAIVLSVHVTPFGKKHEKLLIARDVTEIYHLDQAKRNFVANVSHELRTPLTVITGYLETLADDVEEYPEWARSVELMQLQAKSMDSIISDLLTLSRLEMTEKASSSGPVPVPELLTTIMAEGRLLSGAAEQTLTLNADPELWLVGNAEELRSAFSNLVFNAVKHTPNRTQIKVSWYGNADGAHFSVSDNGEGIATRHIARLTERFYRVDDGRSRKSGGTGLGLAIVKHALYHYGGELEISSEVGHGSTFTCHFPPDVVISREMPDEPVADTAVADAG